jgi:small conductance mechanosensitive channel
MEKWRGFQGYVSSVRFDAGSLQLYFGIPGTPPFRNGLASAVASSHHPLSVHYQIEMFMGAFFQSVLSRFSDLFEAETVGVWVADRAADVLVAIGTFLIFYLLWLGVSRILQAFSGKVGLDPTAARFVKTVAKTGILAVGIITALAMIGINTASVVASLGIAGLTIGFAAQDALSNIISGLFIFWDRPFVIGDLIEVDGFYGRVDDITMRSTRVVTSDGKMLAVPNTTMVNSTVASYTNFPHLRVGVDLTIGSSEDINRARRLLLELVSEDDTFMADPQPKVVVLALNDYNIEIGLRAWIHDERQHGEVKARLLEQINELFQSEGVDMPLETIQLAPFSIIDTDNPKAA